MVYTPQPLRPAGESDGGSESPEALFISALLEIGDFAPERYQVRDEHPVAWTKLWAFAKQYQEKTGVAPGMSLVAKRFPDFELTPNVDPNWAAGELRKAAAARDMRKHVGRALGYLADEDLPAAYGELRDLQPPVGVKRRGTSPFDHALLEEEIDVARIEVPYPTLGRATGGMHNGELWYVAGRSGHGKSHTLLGFAATAAKSGWNVGILSLEMPNRQIAARLNRRLAAHDKELLRRIDSDDRETRKIAIDELQHRIPGNIEISGPAEGRVTNDTVRDMLPYFDLVIVDHAGLMTNSSGRRAIEDWRVMAEISNAMKADVLAADKCILAAAQINREGENSSIRPPRASTISQSDAIPQDGDVVITMKRISQRVLSFSGEKIREGPSVQWFARFDVPNLHFEEVSKDKALEQASRDDDFDIFS